MLKKTLSRALLGFPLGVFLSYSISIVISTLEGQGAYLPVTPELSRLMSSEMGAVVLQYFLSGILGAGMAASSVVWETENWSLLKRTFAHLVLMALFMFPVAYFAYWMEHTLLGVAIYFLFFLAIYAAIWASIYFTSMRSVREINQKLHHRGK